MSFISPLERLADKFNILSFNTRELISKLSIWNTSTEQTLNIMLKVENPPYFENYSIPTLSAIKNSTAISSWSNNRPVGVKFWGTSMLVSSNISTDNNYHVVLNYSNYPLNHYFEYNGALVEGQLQIDLDVAQLVGDVMTFFVKINPQTLTGNGNYFVYFNDLANNTLLLKLGQDNLVNLVESSPSLSTNNHPKMFKVSFQYVNDPYSVTGWKLLDLYQIPSSEYFNGNTTLSSSNFKDPFIQ